MKKSKNVCLSLILSLAILICSQPAFAVSNDDDFHDSGVKASIEIVAEETEPLKTSDLSEKTEKTTPNLENDSSDNSLIGRTTMKEIQNVKANFVKTNSAKAAASGPDLAIGNLAVNGATQPFSYTQYTNFEMLVANIGGQSISNVTVTWYVDGIKISVLDNLGTFAPGFGGTFTVPVKGLSGKHQIAFTIAGSATETNTSNNACGNDYTWQSVIDLAAMAPTQVDDPIVYAEQFDVKAPIANYGNLPATGVSINFELAGKNAGSITIDVPAMTRKTLTLNITFYTCITGQLTVKVDKNNTINDADRSNNNITKQFTVTDAVLGKYKDATNIIVGMAPSTRDLLDGTGNHISFDDAKNAILKWNGITSRAKIGHVAGVPTEEPDGYNVVLQATVKGADDFIARTHTLTNGQWIDPSLRVVELNTYFFNGNDSSIGKNELKRTLTHEMGHVFGLEHPLCGSRAIMRQSTDIQEGLASYNIELHDKQNLLFLY